LEPSRFVAAQGLDIEVRDSPQAVGGPDGDVDGAAAELFEDAQVREVDQFYGEAELSGRQLGLVR
jgi:hypothetical protein